MKKKLSKNMYVLITCFHESYSLLYFFFREKMTVILAFYNLFWFFNENIFRTDQSKWKMSCEKIRFCRFRIRENMWWTRYRPNLWRNPLQNQSGAINLGDLFWDLPILISFLLMVCAISMDPVWSEIHVQMN